MNQYNELNSHPRDGRIKFLPIGHRYLVDGNLSCTSVTQLVEQCVEQFDADYWAARKATPMHTAEQIKAEWEAKGKASRDLGTLMHARIEAHYLGHEHDADTLNDRTFGMFLDFHRNHPLTPYRTEWVIFDEDHSLAGTLDFLAVNPDGSFEIYDWKRSTKVVGENGMPIPDKYGKRAFAPISHVADTTFNHYALQLSIYRYILATKYGIVAREAHLGVFHPDMRRYHVVDVPYLEEEVKALFERRL